MISPRDEKIKVTVAEKSSILEFTTDVSFY